MSQKIQTSSRMMTISVMTPPPMYMECPFRSIAEVLIPHAARGETEHVCGRARAG